MMLLAALHAWTEALLGAPLFKFVRFLIAGGLAAGTNLIAFSLLVHIGKVYYLHASVTAFLLSMAVSFTMQKFWTFRDSLLKNVPGQFVRYSVVLSLSLILNVSLLYFFVEILKVWTILAQAIAVVAVAIFNYFGYQYFVFRDSSPASMP